MAGMDPESGCARSVLYSSNHYGRFHVHPAEDESAASGSHAGKTDDVFADRFFDHILLFPVRIGAVLGRQQFAVDSPAVLD